MTRREGPDDGVIAGSTRPEPSGSVAMVGAQRPKPYTAPEAFTSDLQGKSGNSAVVSKISIQIDRYTPEQDRLRQPDAGRFRLSLCKGPSNF